MMRFHSRKIRKINKIMELLSKQRKAKLEACISLEHLVHNFNAVRAVTDSRICCVIKADAYGHGAWQCARTLAAAGADFFAVSSIAEAEEVRLALADYGDAIGILILGYTIPDNADLLIRYNISQTVFSRDYADALRDAIALKNRERRALANFYHLGQLNPPALSGSDILKVVYGATFRFDKEALINELDAITARVRQQWEEGQRLDPRPRILITGCPIGGAAEKVVRAIEENGGWVVGYENCTGAKATEQCVAETGDVYDALADKYLAIGCSCVSPNDQRLQMLSQMVEEYQVDGVVDVILQACHTYAVESLAIKRHVRQQHNIPYIAIETDYSTSDVGQLSTRVAAFIEML